HFGGQHNSIAAVADGPADDPLRLALGVDVGGVDEIDAIVDGPVDDADRVGFAGRAAEHHCAETKLGDLHPRRTEVPIAHGSIPATHASGRRPSTQAGSATPDDALYCTTRKAYKPE